MNKKIVYLTLTCLLVLPQLLKAQKVGIGTTAPVAALEVNGHSRNGTLSYTDSVLNGFTDYANYEDAPAGTRGELRAPGGNAGSGVLGLATASNSIFYGSGVTGKGRFTGMLGLGMANGYSGIYAIANGAIYGLYVDGNSRLAGDITISGSSVLASHAKNAALSHTDSAIGSFTDYANYENAPAGMRGEFRAPGTNAGSGVLGLATASSSLFYGAGVTGKGRFTGVLGVGMNNGYAAVYALGNSATYALSVSGISLFNGNISGTGTNTYTSDRKLKKDIQPLSGALDIISRLKPASYQFRVGEFGDMYLSEGKHYGVIAQELQEVLPELVLKQHYHPAGEKEKGFDYLSVNYNELIPILIKAIQEQQQKIEALEQKLAIPVKGTP